MEMNKQSRGQFLKTLGLSSKALMAFYCIGAVSSCSKEDETVAPTSNTNNPPNTGNTSTDAGVTGSISGTNIAFTIDLKNSNFAKLTTPGEFSVIGEVLVANTNGTFIAVAKTCTHAGSTLAYRKSEGDIWCNNHGSEFKTDGVVKKDPATSNLKTYNITFDATANTLKIN
jgi:cytochrome b6-f complex iron-sulfur subunit